MLFLIIFTIVAAVLALGGLFMLTFVYVVFIENRNAIAATEWPPRPTLERSGKITTTPVSLPCQMS